MYSWDVSKRPVDELLEFDWLESTKREKLGEEGLVFPRLIIAGALEHIDDIDKQIRDNLDNWDFNRLNRVDLAILSECLFASLPKGHASVHRNR